MITLQTELAKIRGIGENFLHRLLKLNIKTVRDLLWHFPSRYEDFSHIVTIANIEAHQLATIRGIIKNLRVRRTWRRRMVLIEATIADTTGTIKAIWFNQPYLTNVLRPGLTVNLAGKVTFGEDELYLSNPTYEVVRPHEEMKHTAGLIPIYPETKGLTSRGLRYLVKPILQTLTALEDWLPREILDEHRLPPLVSALRNIHFPKTIAETEDAKLRFAFEDIFLLQLNNIRTRSKLSRAKALPLVIPEETIARTIEGLPFTLTPSQEKSLHEILQDLQKPHPMNRLLQGDVGSGKTVIAAIAALMSAQNRFQAAFMAPTEILAHQHYLTFQRIFPELITNEKLSVALLTGSDARIYFGEGLEEKVSKKKLLENIEKGGVQIVIGTHALIEKSIRFANLAFVTIDEQHRFGVEQRARLVAQQSILPHFLSMSATPIPRTLSLTLFGDLDVSIINELPKGRKPTVTKVVDPVNRAKAYGFIREQIKKGRQAFVICPRIDPTEPTTDEDAEHTTSSPNALLRRRQMTLWEVKAVKEEFEKLSTKIFPDLRLAMLHGKMSGKEKEATMTAFKNEEINILVSTSVVEVGVDVPNATIMVIEGADRFGLAQLYQFRGRIGRGSHQSFCFLFTDSASASVRDRLAALINAKNGFELAEEDLKIRGPGQFLGDKQTGLPDLAMRSLTNIELIKSARGAAESLLQKDHNLIRYPLLKERLSLFEERVHLE